MNLVSCRTRNGNPRWEISFYYRDASGKTVRFRRNARVQNRLAAEREAKELFAKLSAGWHIPTKLEEVEDAVPKPPKGYTFQDAVEDYRKGALVRPRTLDGYEMNFQAHLLPRFGTRLAATIGMEDIMAIRSDLKDREVQTVNNIETALRAVLRHAVRCRRLAVFPSLPGLRHPPRREFVPPTPDEVRLLLDAADWYVKLPVALAGFAGFRAGEIRGLRFRDLNLDAGFLIVRKSISKKFEGPPKSGSDRSVPLTPELTDLLRSAALRPHTADDFVALNSLKRPWGDGGIRAAFQRTLAKAQLERKRLHDLRHFFVTQCFQAGVPAPDVQALAGHHHLHVTQRYAHSGEQSRRDAIQKLGEHLARGASNGPTTAR